jgi:hypothetical protein
MNTAVLNGELLNGASTPSALVDIRAALVAQLRASDLVNLVGSNIFAIQVPQRTAKGSVSCVYQLIDDPRGYHLGGPNGIAEARIQIKIQAAAHADCITGVQTLRGLFAASDLGFVGILGGLIEVIGTFLHDERDHYDQPADASDQGTFAISQDYLFRYRE